MSAGRLATLTLFVLLSGCQGGAPTPGDAAPPTGGIVIASDLPTSTFYGDVLPVQQAIALAIAQHPTIGRFKLTYWPLDDAVAGNASQEKGIQNVSQMVDDNSVLGMVGPFNSYVSDVTIPIANQADLVMVSPSNTSFCLTRSSPTCGYSLDSIHPSGHINFFRIAPPDPVQGSAMARYAVLNLKVKRVAVINEWGSDGSEIISSFTRVLERLGGRVLDREDVGGGTTDFKRFLAQARSHGAQAIYATGDVDGKICLARAQMGDPALFLGTDGITGYAGCLDQAAGTSESMIATKPDVDITNSSESAARQAFQAYRQRYPNSTPTEYTFAAYDCALILIDGIGRAIEANDGSIPNRSQVLAAVRLSDFTGVTGRYSFDKYGDAKAPLMSIYDVAKGKWAYVDRIEASALPS